MAATAAGKALLLSRFTDLSIKSPSLHPNLFSRPFLKKHSPSSSSSSLILSCLFSGIDGNGGGGVADEFISTRKFDRGFSVISTMLKRIEPLDTSTICKGVSVEARESMKRTISTMLEWERNNDDDLMFLYKNSKSNGYVKWIKRIRRNKKWIISESLLRSLGEKNMNSQQLFH